MKENVNDIKNNYILLHEKYKHLSNVQIMYHYIVLLYIVITSTISVIIAALEITAIISINIFDRGLVLLLLFFPTFLTCIWIIYYLQLIKCRHMLLELKRKLDIIGIYICYSIDKVILGNIYFKSEEELGADHIPICFSEKDFAEYDNLCQIKNKLF